MKSSLDPRVNRLKNLYEDDPMPPKEKLDQLITFEVFLQKKPGLSYEHVGIVHASSIDMAFLFAKEQFSRRFTCSGMWVARTQDVITTDFMEQGENIYDSIKATDNPGGATHEFEVFHLIKRGKQHIHAGRVEANNFDDAIYQAKVLYDDEKPKLNVWIIKTSDILFSSSEDQVIWDTLSEKKYRDAIAYKAMDKIKKYKEEQTQSNG